MTDAAITVRPIDGDHYAILVRGHEIEVDQPVPSGGTDAAPTPSELFVASLASCAAFYVGRFLRRHGATDGKWAIECCYDWSDDRPSRIQGVRLELVLPPGTPDEVRDGAVRAADHCTVRESVRAGVDVRIDARVTAAAPELMLA